MSCKINHAPEIEGFLQKEYTPGDAIYFCIINDHAIRAMGCGSNVDILEACLQLLQTADAGPDDLSHYAHLRKIKSFDDIRTGFQAFKARNTRVDAEKEAAEQAIRDLLRDDKPKR